jgi:hypothetical protein
MNNYKHISSWDLVDNPPVGNKIERSLFVEARLWFDKVNGNTYFTARVWVDGNFVLSLPFQYGYDHQYLYEANKQLINAGYLPTEFEGKPLHIAREAYKFDYYYSESYGKKSEMFKEAVK